MKKFHVLSLSISAGIMWGLGLFLLAILGIYGIGDEIIVHLSDAYIGLDSTVLGAFIGFVWGFVDAFIGGAIFALLYNFFTSKLN